AVLHASRGRADEAREASNAAIAAAKGLVRGHPRDAVRHYKLGNALRQSSDLERGIIAQLRLEGTITPVRFLKDGDPPLARDRLHEAILEYREAVRLKPDSAAFHLELGDALSLEPENADAVRIELQEAVRLLPNNPGIRARLGNHLSF